jgi:hypothetical protein
MGFVLERNRPPPRPEPVFRFPPGLSRKGVRRSWADRGEAPFVLFVCQDEDQRDLFLAAADRELTGHLWHPSVGPERHVYVGRRRVLFACELDIHSGRLEAWRLPSLPPGDPRRRGPADEVRAVGLPGHGRSGTAKSPSSGLADK